MPGTMSRSDLADDLRDSLHDAAGVFADPEDFFRHLDISSAALARVRPRTEYGSISLTAGKAEYFAPADMLSFVADTWGAGITPQAWEINYPGPNPRVRLVTAAGVRSLLFTPPPTGLQIALYGSVYPFQYLANHTVVDTAADTTVPAGDRGLLLLRAQAEALREMAIRNVGKPVQMRDGMTGTPRNGTPAALYQALLEEFEAAA